MSVQLYNSLTRKVEEFKPINQNEVLVYTCGPTVYSRAHIGNLRYLVFTDLLRRVLKSNKYNVKQVMNITDVGHLTDDGDLGEDKLEKAYKLAQTEGRKLTIWDIANAFTDFFVQDRDLLNVEPPEYFVKATENVPEMIEIIKTLESKGYAYVTEKAVYFDTSKFIDYTELSGLNLEELKEKAREEVVTDSNKRNPADFRLWQLDQPDHSMQWDSPWGKGFPGWHIECSAMAMKYLGEQIDIHTGGVDHISVHHTNEIAQSECATGKKFANYWLHCNFLKVDGAKMSKSLGNVYVLTDIIEKGYSPMDLRYLFLAAHYRFPQNFTIKALDAAKNAREKLVQEYLIARTIVQRAVFENKAATPIIANQEMVSKFNLACSADLNIPEALAIVWKS